MSLTTRRRAYRGVSVAFPPQIVFAPSFGVTQAEVASEARRRGDKIQGQRASRPCSLDGEVDHPLVALRLDGALVIHAVAGGDRQG